MLCCAQEISIHSDALYCAEQLAWQRAEWPLCSGRWGKVLCIYSKWHSIHDMVLNPVIARIHMCRNGYRSRNGYGRTHHHPLWSRKISFPVLMTVICSADLELGLDELCFLQGSTAFCWIGNQFPHGCFGLLMPLSQGRSYVLGGVINQDYQGKNQTASPQWRWGRLCLEYRIL